MLCETHVDVDVVVDVVVDIVVDVVVTVARDAAPTINWNPNIKYPSRPSIVHIVI